LRGECRWRAQTVVATPGFFTRASNSSTASAGVFQPSSLLKNPKNLAFVLPRVLLWDDLFKSLKRFGGPDAALATLQPVWGCGSGYRRSD
jgi:hypothetical protein